MAEGTTAYIPNQELSHLLQTLFGKLPELQLTRDNTALMVTDVQYMDAHPDYGLGARAKKLGIAGFLDYYWSRIVEVVLPNMQRLLASARQAGVSK